MTLMMNAAKMTKISLIRHLCHIFSQIVVLEKHTYLSLILEKLGNKVGFFQQKGEIETGNN